MYKLLLLFCFLFLITKANAQQINNTDTDHNIKAKDTALVDIPMRYQNCKRRSPILAGALSILLPTAGQIYNKQYLKAGVIWIVGGITLTGALVNSLNNRFHKNGATNIYLTLAEADVLYAIVDAPLSAIHLNRKYHLGKKTGSLATLQISPDIINTGAGNKIEAGFSLVLR